MSISTDTMTQIDPLYQVKPTTGGNAELWFNGERKSTGTMGAITQQANDQIYGTQKPTTQPVTPTTLSSSNVQNTYVPQQKDKLNNLSQKGSITNPETGQVTLPTGQAADLQLVRENNGTYTGIDGLKYYNYDSTPVGVSTTGGTDSLDTRSREILNKLQADSDALTSSIISNIKTQYENLKIQQKDINDRYKKGVDTAAIMGGTARYAAGTAEGMTASAMSYGLQKLSELDQKENEAILKAKQAQQDMNWKIASVELDKIEKIRQEKVTAATNLNNKLIEQNNQIRQQEETRNNAINDDIRTLMSKASGLTPEQLADLQTTLKNHDYVSARGIVGDTGSSSLDNLSGDVKTFYALKEMGNLPTNILALPKDQQMFTFIKQLNQAQSVKTGTGTSETGQAFASGNVPFQSTIENAASLEGTNAGVARTQKELANLATVGDYKGLLIRVQNQAKKGMASVDKVEVTKAEKQVKAADRMAKALQDFEAAGGDMGYFKGKTDKIATRLGQLATDPKFKALATELTAAFQQYRQDMTGAAFGAAESADYATVVPTADKNLNLNYAVIQGLKNYMQGKVDDAYSTSLGEGYQNIKGLAESGGQKSNLGGSTPDDFLNSPLPTGTSTNYSPSVWSNAK